ncbi:phage integrase family protein [Octadecabacter antarcticus 307]|uniref:Phage integrase family protein n=1 Tax=Octadecabacter antarcticus 307 TaxID=391626 RepID=M9RB66_9RHOB|nr:site-specific integrase [Octadecabacter antarcticus]AGI67040.1 phage integrase family protein [Octadecabacter antarcticus 307]
MALGKQAKVLNRSQVSAVQNYLAGRRNTLRNQTIFLLSIKAGLRAKEIAKLRWEMVLDADGTLSAHLSLSNDASKGNSGRRIPLNKDLKAKLNELYDVRLKGKGFGAADHVIRTERSDRTSPQAIVNMFSGWYRDLGLIGCSSHSGRRTFVTNAAQKITTVGGSLRDVQYLAGHSSLQTTERYIEYSEKARRSIVDII